MKLSLTNFANAMRESIGLINNPSHKNSPEQPRLCFLCILMLRTTTLHRTIVPNIRILLL